MIYLNIGSNIEPRRAYLRAAVEALRRYLPGEYRVSEEVESEPWGYVSTARYINIGVAVEPADAAISAMDVLEATQRAQTSVDASPHRDETGGYIDRRIDIDIIAIDRMMVEGERLTLPHPRMDRREFVLKPMAELAPEWRHPASGLTCGEMLEKI